MAFRPDYEGILDDTAKSMSLNEETYTGDKREQSLSSGLLCTDLILGNGGWIPGWHTSLGMEQSAKTTSVIHTMHEALTADTPMIQVWDYEKSFSVKYASQFFNNFGGMSPETFGLRDDNGKWVVTPKIRSFDESTGEVFFNSLHRMLKGLPRKRKIGGNWFYMYANTKENKAKLGDELDAKTSKLVGQLCSPAEDGRPQGFVMLDSYPTMLPESMDEDTEKNPIALQARFFSDNLKKVKAMVTSRGFIVLGINQLRKIPMALYGPTEMEPCGEALKLLSDLRLQHKSCSIPPNMKTLGEKDGQNLTEAGLNGGTDMYRFITVDTVKNKVGGAPRGTRIYHRIWVEDERGIARGLDPVFDGYQFFQQTGQLDGTVKKFSLNIAGGNPLNGIDINWTQFKTFIIGTEEQQKDLGNKLGVAANPRLREAGFKQLQDGTAYDMFNGNVEDDVEEPVSLDEAI